MVASVLIVESNETIRSLTAEILEERGFATSEAATLASALEQLAADPNEFDLLLVEAGMPDGNGLDFIGSLRALGFNRPIVVVSSASREISRAAECGANAWLQKPFSVKSLLQMVDAAVMLHANHIRGAIQAPVPSLPFIC